MDHLGPPPKMLSGYQLVLIMKVRYTKLRRAIQIYEKTASRIALLFSDNLVILYGIPACILRDHRIRFISKLFEVQCAFLGMKQLKSTVYHLQMSGHAERMKKGIIA